MMEKYLNDVKAIDKKIAKKEKELVDLRKKKEQAQSKLFADIIKTNNLDLDELVAIFDNRSENNDKKEGISNGGNN